MDEDNLDKYFNRKEHNDDEEEDDFYLLNPPKQRLWSHSWFINNPRSQSNLIEEYRHSPKHFREHMRMSENSYIKILNLVSPLIIKQTTHLRRSITPHERLTATLQWMASGVSITKLSKNTNISTSALSGIIVETLMALLDKFQDQIRLPESEDEWLLEAEKIRIKHNGVFPNVVGCIDGSHIEITKPEHSGSMYWSYLQKFTVNLMAVVGADYKFLYVSVGNNGSRCDSVVLRSTKFYQRLKNDTLNLPKERSIGNNSLPYVFLGDQGFALEPEIMIPYSKARLRDDSDGRCHTFNYHLSALRRIVENAFGQIKARFPILKGPITCKLETMDKLVFVCCLLHNFLKNEGKKHFF